MGRDVESIVRDLVETAVALVLEEEKRAVQARATEHAEERLLDALLPPPVPPAPGEPLPPVSPDGTREKLRQLLRQGDLDDREVDIELDAQTDFSELRADALKPVTHT